MAVTGASEGVLFRWSEAEAALSKNFSDGSIKDLSIDNKNMIEDIHASKEYRAHLVKVMTKRAVANAS